MNGRPMVSRDGSPTAAHPEQVPASPPAELAARAAELAAPRAEVEPAALILSGVPASVREFRELVRRAALTDWQAEAAALCVSEVVTNAITHTPSGRPGGTVMVIVEPGPVPGEMRVSVISQGELWQWAPRPGEICPEHGHGLRIVDAVAADWGIGYDPPGLTWFDVAGPEPEAGPWTT